MNWQAITDMIVNLVNRIGVGPVVTMVAIGAVLYLPKMWNNIPPEQQLYVLLGQITIIPVIVFSFFKYRKQDEKPKKERSK